MHSLQLNTDCEGPLVLNDNAFELCREFLPLDGGRFFTQVSRYDDYLADIARRPGYKAGDTLKLILPFLKLAGLTNAQVAEYSRNHLTLVPGAEEAYRFLHSLELPLYMVSASYRPFAEAVAARLGFAPDCLYCTELDLDGYILAEKEAQELRRFLEEILAAPTLELPSEAKAPEDLPPKTRESIRIFDRIFWDLIPRLSIGRICEETNTMGGPEKVRALELSLAQTGLTFSQVMYVGDSITDVPALEKVRSKGGLAVSFNGNRYAVEAAEVMVVADTAWPVPLLVAVFREWGKEGVVELARSTGPGGSRYLVLPEAVIEPIARGLQGSTFNLYHRHTSRREEVFADSLAMRRRLRGEAIALLG